MITRVVTEQAATEQAARVDRRNPRPRVGALGSTAGLLALQRQAGNAAVASLLAVQRQDPSAGGGAAGGQTTRQQPVQVDGSATEAPQQPGAQQVPVRTDVRREGGEAAQGGGQQPVGGTTGEVERPWTFRMGIGGQGSNETGAGGGLSLGAERESWWSQEGRLRWLTNTELRVTYTLSPWAPERAVHELEGEAGVNLARLVWDRFQLGLMGSASVGGSNTQGMEYRGGGGLAGEGTLGAERRSTLSGEAGVTGGSGGVGVGGTAGLSYRLGPQSAPGAWSVYGQTSGEWREGNKVKVGGMLGIGYSF